jgi:Neuraminidase (sialidase)
MLDNCINGLRYRANRLPSHVSLSYDLPSTLVISLDYAKNVLKAKLNTSDDTYITDLIYASTKDSEDSTDRSYITRTIVAFWENVYDTVYLPKPPHISITSVETVDKEGNVELLVENEDYYVIGIDELKLVFPRGIGRIGLKVTYVAGYGASASDMPFFVKDAVSQRVRYKYAKEPQEAVMAKYRINDAESTNRYYRP